MSWRHPARQVGRLRSPTRFVVKRAQMVSTRVICFDMPVLVVPFVDNAGSAVVPACPFAAPGPRGFRLCFFGLRERRQIGRWWNDAARPDIASLSDARCPWVAHRRPKSSFQGGRVPQPVGECSVFFNRNIPRRAAQTPIGSSCVSPCMEDQTELPGHAFHDAAPLPAWMTLHDGCRSKSLSGTAHIT